MLNSFNFDKLTIPIASSMVGLIPVLINLTFTWLDKRSQNARLNLVLQQSNQRITFLSNWLTLQEKIARPEQLPVIKGMVSEELNEVYEAFIEAVLEPDKETKRRKGMLAKARSINPFRRFFLIYLPYNVSGWVFHTLYYMTGLQMLAVIGFIIYTFIQTRVWLEGVPPEYIYLGIGGFIFAGFFRWLGRIAAGEIEEKLRRLDQKTTPLRASGLSS